MSCDKLWQCDHCTALFRTSGEADAHKATCASLPSLRERVGNKIWFCDYCPAMFATFDDATVHEASCNAKLKATKLVKVDYLRSGNNYYNEGRCRVCGKNCFRDRYEIAYRVCEGCASEVFGCEESHELGRYFNDREVDGKDKADMDKRDEGEQLMIMTYNVTPDVLRLFDIAESIDSMVIAFNRPGWAFQQTTKAKLPPKFQLKERIEQMKGFPERIRQSSERFCRFEASPKHHPYHLHKKSLSKLSQQMEQASTSFLTRYDELPDDSYPSESQVAHIKKHFNESTIPTFSKVAKKLRGLIKLPQFCPDTMYSKTHAISVVMKYGKGTHERGVAIKDMALLGCVPSKTAFYNAINRFEKEEGNVMIDCWNATNGPSKKGCLRDLRCGSWLAHIYMPAIPVDCDYDGNPIMDKDTILALYKTPRIIDISDYMGLIKGEFKAANKVGVGGRIYFSPHQFPTPLNLDIAGSANDKVFQRLKNCIQKYCEDAGSPVVCNGGKVGSKKFVCSHKMKARKRKLTTDIRYNCRYSFTVKWDKFGYFIALRNRRKQSECFIGCTYHNHE